MFLDLPFKKKRLKLLVLFKILNFPNIQTNNFFISNKDETIYLINRVALQKDFINEGCLVDR